MAERTVYISFSAQVNGRSIQALIEAAGKALNEQKPARFIFLMSAPPEDYSEPKHAEAAISGLNFLKAMPAEVQTHNFGRLATPSLVLFCAGARRSSSPHASFSLDELKVPVGEYTYREAEALLKRLGTANENVSRILAATTGKSKQQVDRAIRKEVTFNPEDAQKFGLVHEIRELRVEKGAELISIG